MASLLAASRQDPAAARGLHARTETVRLGAAAFARLICALWQSNPPISTYAWLSAGIARRKPRTGRLGGKIRIIKFTGGWRGGQENDGLAYRERKSDTPLELEDEFVTLNADDDVAAG